MFKINLIIVLVTLVAVIPGISIADIPELVIWEGSGTYEIGSGKDWFVISELRTYDDVTVKMYVGGGVTQFSMYDNSELIKYASSVADLYLYDNATASFYGGSAPMELYIDLASTGWVKLYADFDRFEPYGPYGEGTLYGNWLAGGSFNIDLVGHGAYSHIQFIPEPTTIMLFTLGGLAILKRHKR